MKVLVDTSVWSLALRRNPPQTSREVQRLSTLIHEGERIYLAGIILQELLQGIRTVEQFRSMRDTLAAFPMLEASREDHALAAEIFNACRSRGFQPSTIDVLIAALAIRHECVLLTADRDFTQIARNCELKVL